MTLSEAQTSRHPAGDVRSSTADSGLPLLPQDTFSTCRAHYPGGLSRCFSVGFYAAPRAGFFPRHAGLPGPNIRSASTVQLFEACSSFTRVTARRFAHPPDVGLVGRLRHRPLPGGIASQLHRHTETSCGGTCTHWWSCAISAHIGFVWSGSGSEGGSGRTQGTQARRPAPLGDGDAIWWKADIVPQFHDNTRERGIFG